MKTSQFPAKKENRFFRREYIPLHLMALPAVLYLLIFHYTPMIGVLMAFQRYNIRLGFFRSEFVGFQNFRFLFATTDAFVITRNTVLYHFAYLIVGYLLSITAALIISSLRTKRTAKFLQSIYIMPYFLSWTAVSIAVTGLLSTTGGGGPISQIMALFGIEPFNNNWFMTRPFWPPFLIAMSAWKGVGYSTILYTAVISGISPELYEAAMMEGAGKFKQAWYITIPHLRFIFTITLIMSMGTIVQGNFGLHYTVPGPTAGYLIPVVDIIDTYIYRGLRSMGNLGMSAAAGLYQSFVGMVMILFSNWIVVKINPESALI